MRDLPDTILERPQWVPVEGASESQAGSNPMSAFSGRPALPGPEKP